jgi:uncharacterized protein YbcC (UPF0753/DUF2309 family)
MANEEKIEYKSNNQVLNSITGKMVCAFMDEGLAEWEMPNKEDGFLSLRGES